MRPAVTTAAVMTAAALAALTACAGSPRGGAGPTPSHAQSSTTVSATPATEPPLPPFPGTLIFAKVGGQWGEETFFVKHRGKPEHQYPGLQKGRTCCYRISLNGEEIMFAGNLPDGRITIVVEPLEGAPSRVLPIRDPALNLGPGAWTADGTRIAAQGWVDSQPRRAGIYLVDAADGGHPIRLTSGPDDPGAFSPDGRWLAFFERRSTDGSNRLMVMPADGSGQPRPVTPPGFPAGAAVRFSPDSRRMVFCRCEVDHAGSLWTVAPDGTQLHQLWGSPTQYASYPAWSPDGSQVVFTLNDVDYEDAYTPNALAVINADGSDFHVAFRDGDFVRETTWLP
jgi:dipeptidyl aminopeptidase/acylaminoacyl peptidase